MTTTPPPYPPPLPPPTSRPVRLCSMAGCHGKHVAKGLCQHHYDKRRGGSGPKPTRKTMSQPDRPPVHTIADAISNVLARFATAEDTAVLDLANALDTLAATPLTPRMRAPADHIVGIAAEHIERGQALTLRNGGLVPAAPDALAPPTMVAPPHWAETLDAWNGFPLDKKQTIWVETLKRWAKGFTSLADLRKGLADSAAEGRIPFDARINDLVIQWWMVWHHENSAPDPSGPHENVKPANPSPEWPEADDLGPGDPGPDDLDDLDDLDF